MRLSNQTHWIIKKKIREIELIKTFKVIMRQLWLRAMAKSIFNNTLTICTRGRIASTTRFHLKTHVHQTDALTLCFRRNSLVKFVFEIKAKHFNINVIQNKNTFTFHKLMTHLKAKVIFVNF